MIMHNYDDAQCAVKFCMFYMMMVVYVQSSI